MNERIVDPQGLVHEIIAASPRVPTQIEVRCTKQFPPQMGPKNIRDPDTVVTCLQCLGMPDSKSLYEESDRDDGDGWGSGGGGGLGG